MRTKLTAEMAKNMRGDAIEVTSKSIIFDTMSFYDFALINVG